MPLLILILTLFTGSASSQSMFCHLSDCRKTNQEPAFSFRKINDTKPVFDSVTLIGTRNSYDFNIENEKCKAQTMPIEQQFVIGIRAFHVKISQKIYGEYRIKNDCGFTYALLSTLIWQLSRLIDENDFVILYIEQENIENTRDLARLLDDLLRYSPKVRVAWDFRDSKYFLQNKILIHITGFKFPLQHCTTIKSSEDSVMKRWPDIKTQIIQYEYHLKQQRFENCLVIFLGKNPQDITAARLSGGVEFPYDDSAAQILLDDFNLENTADFNYDCKGKIFETGMNELFTNGWIPSDFSFNIIFVDFPSQKMVNYVQIKFD